jgi:hypothetical protein
MSFMFNGASDFNQDISEWNITSLAYANNMLSGSSFSLTNYDKLLTNWSSQTIVLNNVDFRNTGLTYSSNGLAGHIELDINKSWTFGTDTYVDEPLILVYNFTDPTKLTLTLPISGTNLIIKNIDWGDGTNSNILESHTYTSVGERTVTISGTNINNLNNYINNVTNVSARYLTSCNSFGNIGLTNLTYGFMNCEKLISVPDLLPSNVTILLGTFINANEFDQPLIWDTTNIINMIEMFGDANLFNSALNFNTTNVKYMSNMFRNTNNFDKDISLWIVSSLLDAIDMFIDNKTMSITNFNNLLTNWSLQTVKTGVRLSEIIYSESAKNSKLLLESKGWDFTSVGIPDSIRNIDTFNIEFTNYITLTSETQYICRLTIGLGSIDFYATTDTTPTKKIIFTITPISNFTNTIGNCDVTILKGTTIIFQPKTFQITN